MKNNVAKSESIVPETTKTDNSIKSILYRLVCGVVMGVGGVLPGVSGGILAISLGIYEKTMSAIGNFLQNVKGNFRYLFPLAIGVGVGILLTSNLLTMVIDRYEVQLLSLFTGLVLGSLPELLAEVKQNTPKIRWKHVLAVVLGLGFVLLFALGESSVATNSEKAVLTIPGALISGAVLSVGTVIPGISSSFILVFLGLYPAVISAIASVMDFSSLASGGIPAALAKLSGSFLPLLVMTAMFAVVSLGIIKIVNRMLKRHHAMSYAAVIGFVIGSVVLVLPGLLPKLTWACPIFFAAGLALTLLERYFKVRMQRQNAAGSVQTVLAESRES
jgi:putative membrane protein